MTGPEHFREAELLAESAAGFVGLPNEAHVQQARVAQIHATLALVATQDANRPPVVVNVSDDLTPEGAANIQRAIRQAFQ